MPTGPPCALRRRAPRAAAAADHGSLSLERVHRLCGDNLEHVYEAARITTHGVQCMAIAWHAAEADTLIAGTSTNHVGACPCRSPMSLAHAARPHVHAQHRAACGPRACRLYSMRRARSCAARRNRRSSPGRGSAGACTPLPHAPTPTDPRRSHV